ncbi:hypothetical protein EN783_32960, partial [Mesorhizobium sp. M2D.F.Ca.ET.140.01.1.1]
LSRLFGSAAELGFACDPQKIGDVLGKAVDGARKVLRARLALSRNGDATASVQPFEPLAADKIWTLRLARTRLDSHDMLLRHKTSRRLLY